MNNQKAPLERERNFAIMGGGGDFHGVKKLEAVCCSSVRFLVTLLGRPSKKENIPRRNKKNGGKEWAGPPITCLEQACELAPNVFLLLLKSLKYTPSPYLMPLVVLVNPPANICRPSLPLLCCRRQYYVAATAAIGLLRCPVLHDHGCE